MRKIIGWTVFSLGVFILIANLFASIIILGETNILAFEFWMQFILPIIFCSIGWRISHGIKKEEAID